MEENKLVNKNSDNYLLRGIILLITLVCAFLTDGLFIVTLIVPFFLLMGRIKLAPLSYESVRFNKLATEEQKQAAKTDGIILPLILSWNLLYWGIGSQYVISRTSIILPEFIFLGAIIATMLQVVADILNFFSVLFYYDKKIKTFKENIFKVNLQLDNGYIRPLFFKTEEIDRSSWKTYAFTKGETTFTYLLIPGFSWLGVIFIVGVGIGYLIKQLKPKCNGKILLDRLQDNKNLSSEEVYSILLQIKTLTGRCGHFMFSDEAIQQLEQSSRDKMEN